MTQLSVFKAWMNARLNTTERGANLVEYILLIVFIALVVVAAIVLLQGAISDKFTGAKDCLNKVAGAC